jgi:hypothetical protein
MALKITSAKVDSGRFIVELLRDDCGLHSYRPLKRNKQGAYEQVPCRTRAQERAYPKLPAAVGSAMCEVAAVLDRHTLQCAHVLD